VWSPASIDGRPRLLVIDGSRNLAGWEAAFCDRLFAGLGRRLPLVGDGPLRAGAPDTLLRHVALLNQANCLLVLAHGGQTDPPAWAELLVFLEWLSSHLSGPKLFAGCSWQSYNPRLSQAVLGKTQTFAPLALVPQTPVEPRVAGLFLLKFFTELALHSEDQVTGKMVWFSASKARELVRRRSLTGAFGVRS
jgi:hypothetical protein